ncbi:hypothetical protein AAFF_G00217960 [Aldrovandia affinis]|uniref:Uncharacterized protein n=1 Tax=Aldrovandia affinis TaxID=143900 RepID=A0AAD7WUI0_9TELE|nr:hypothetical protein AAFF_G00217960 [Aldrovandia affinis]
MPDGLLISSQAERGEKAIVERRLARGSVNSGRAQRPIFGSGLGRAALPVQNRAGRGSAVSLEPLVSAVADSSQTSAGPANGAAWEGSITVTPPSGRQITRKAPVRERGPQGSGASSCLQGPLLLEISGAPMMWALRGPSLHVDPGPGGVVEVSSVHVSHDAHNPPLPQQAPRQSGGTEFHLPVPRVVITLNLRSLREVVGETVASQLASVFRKRFPLPAKAKFSRETDRRRPCLDPPSRNAAGDELVSDLVENRTLGISSRIALARQRSCPIRCARPRLVASQRIAPVRVPCHPTGTDSSNSPRFAERVFYPFGSAF